MVYADLNSSGKYRTTDTQFGQPSNKACDVVIGFDFGTSCTKVILQTPYSYGKWCCAVPFNPEKNETEKYLLPSKIYFSRKTGKTSLQKFDAAEVYSNIKIIYLSRNRNKEALSEFNNEGISITTNEFVVAYLANVLQKVRGWFICENARLFEKFRLNWHFNLGIPAGKFSTNNITDFLQLAQAAWDLSVQKETINLKDAYKILKLTTYDKISKGTGTGMIHIIPEVTAEIMGYTKSRTRNDGLHLIIDIGASTLDVAAFHLTKIDDQDHHVQLRTSVSQLGSFMLHEQRIKFVWRQTVKHLSEKYRHLNIMEPLPAEMRPYWPQGAAQGDNEMDFYKRCKGEIYGIIMDLRKHKEPFTEAWEKGLPCFLCGGGRNLPFYQNVIRDIHIDFTKHSNCAGLKQQEIPEPENLHIKDYYRFAVAYGLSFFKHEIGTIKPSNQIKNIEREITSKYRDANFIGQDQV